MLQNGAWQQTTNFAISSTGATGFGTGYAYMQGLRWTDFTGAPAGNQVTVTLTVALTNGSVVASTNFLVRPPPVFLIHGIADTGATWSPFFWNALAQNVPANFIQAIIYGQGTGFNQQWPSCTSSLLDLAKEVDTDLTNVESNLRSNWAFTRYDAVGHSQGGVLLRMLCQTAGASAFSPFTSDGVPVVSGANLYRGRFRRIITIGSPQNGSLIMYYLDQMPASINRMDVFLSSVVDFAAPAIQKFDPNGWQIKFINNADFPVDPKIGFHCIQSTISFGQFPVLNPFSNPPIYNILGLFNPLALGPNAGKTRGQVLIPSGSDGVVDFVSQGGGIGTHNGGDFNNVSHAGPEWLFGVPTFNTETASAAVGADVTNLLSGPASKFGSFVLPQIISQAELNTYNQVIPSVQTIFGAIIQGFTPHIPSTNINYHLVVPSNLPLGGPVNWAALNYGTNGISTNGLSVQINTDDSTQMTLSVNSNVVGQVVLSAEYMDTNGDLVFASPIVALSVPTSSGATLTNIVLEPPAITLAIGDFIPTQIVGDNSDGTQSFLYTSPGQVSYSSSNTNVALVDTDGTITLNSLGTATITAAYQGFDAQTVVTSITPTVTNLFGSIVANGSFQLTFISSFGTTNIVQTSANLTTWTSLATLMNTNGSIIFLDPSATNARQKFYRVLIP